MCRIEKSQQEQICTKLLVKFDGPKVSLRVSGVNETVWAYFLYKWGSACGTYCVCGHCWCDTGMVRYLKEII
jgi:hypothetical protein